MFSEYTKSLLQELKTQHWLPKYNTELINQIKQETQEFVDQLSNLFNSNLDPNDKAQSASLIILHHSILRNRRCVLGYLNYRLNKLQDFYWENGNQLPQHYQDKLDKQEILYFTNYCSLIQKYEQSIGSQGMDISSEHLPPKHLKMQIKIIKEGGSIQLPESGEINLSINSVYNLKRNEAVKLIKCGFAEQIDL